MTRREFGQTVLRGLGVGAVIAVTGGISAVVEAAAPPTQLQFRATKTQTVAQATIATYACQKTYGGRLFTKVGSLTGNLQYLVNNSLILQPASVFQVKKNDVVTWRKV